MTDDLIAVSREALKEAKRDMASCWYERAANRLIKALESAQPVAGEPVGYAKSDVKDMEYFHVIAKEPFERTGNLVPVYLTPQPVSEADPPADRYDIHNWECIGAGLYDDLFECSRCGERYSTQADGPNATPPYFGCQNRESKPEQPTTLHKWDASGERCLRCGDKDWMGEPCKPVTEHALKDDVIVSRNALKELQRLIDKGRISAGARADSIIASARSVAGEPVMRVQFRRSPLDGTPGPKILSFHDLGDGEHDLYAVPQPASEVEHPLQSLADNLEPRDHEAERLVNENLSELVQRHEQPVTAQESDPYSGPLWSDEKTDEEIIELFYSDETNIEGLVVNLMEDIRCLKEQAAADREKYNDLLYQVQNKIPGETRHDTAKRIIAQHENQDNAPEARQGKEG